jgi:hypothetical protein
MNDKPAEDVLNLQIWIPFNTTHSPDDQKRCSHISWAPCTAVSSAQNSIFFSFNILDFLCLKGQQHEIFDNGFFHQTIPSSALIHALKPFRIWLRIRRENRLYSNFSGVIDTAETILAVSLTPLKQKKSWGLPRPHFLFQCCK